MVRFRRHWRIETAREWSEIFIKALLHLRLLLLRPMCGVCTSRIATHRCRNRHRSTQHRVRLYWSHPNRPCRTKFSKHFENLVRPQRSRNVAGDVAKISGWVALGVQLCAQVGQRRQMYLFTTQYEAICDVSRPGDVGGEVMRLCLATRSDLEKSLMSSPPDLMPT